MELASKPSKSQIPNALTMTRVVLALIFPVVSPSLRVSIFVFAMLTEFLDGFLARRLGATTIFGTFLDPAADKLFALSAGLTLLVTTKLTLLELILVLSRDFVVTTAILSLFANGDVKTVLTFRPTWWGKAATALQYAYFFSVLIGYESGSALFWLTAASSVAAAAIYGRQFFKVPVP